MKELSERIVAAAVQFEGMTCVLPPPARHHTILHALDALGLDALVHPDAQGFVTDAGRFVGREEACRVADTAGQILDGYVGRELFSEDLW